MKTLIVYKSKHGAAKEVASYISQKLPADMQEAADTLSVAGYDQILFIGSIYAGRLAKQLVHCIRNAEKELSETSVSMLLSGMGREAPEKVITENLGKPWYQKLSCAECIGGRLDFRQLGFMEKKIIRMVNKQVHLYEDETAELVNQLDWEKIDAIITELSHD